MSRGGGEGVNAILLRNGKKAIECCVTERYRGEGRSWKAAKLNAIRKNKYFSILRSKVLESSQKGKEVKKREDFLGVKVNSKQLNNESSVHTFFFSSVHIFFVVQFIYFFCSVHIFF